MIVDSQCHSSLTWYEPIETLLYHMDANDVEKAILIQHLGEYDNTYLLNCKKRYPDRFAVVAGVDVSEMGVHGRVKRLVEQGISGIRLRPSACSQGDNPLAIWEVAQECDIAVSCAGMSSVYQSVDFSQVVQAVPKLRIVLEHLGGASKPDASDEERQAREYVLELANFENVFIKLPGLGEITPRNNAVLAHEQSSNPESGDLQTASAETRLVMPAEQSPFGSDVPEVLTRAFNLFGSKRMMWGSDFPVVGSREGYANSLHLCRQVFSQLPSQESDAIFGGVAREAFNF